MTLKNQYTFLQFYTLIFGLFIFSCANPIAPTGGLKDIVPPKIIGAGPANKSVNTKPKKIQIQFDEYFVLDNPSQNISVSPPLKNQPEYLVKGKSLQINFSEEEVLLENTTYTINFGSAIKDNNEGNLQDSFVYVFSTGPFLDSLSFQGIIKDAQTGEPEEGFLVGLYTELNDSVVFKSKPVYYTKTKKDGSFRLENLKEDSYKAFAFKDENFSFIKDLSSEKIAYLEKPVEILESSLPVQILSFSEKQPIKLSEHSVKNMGVVQLVFSEPINTFSIGTAAIKDTIQYFNVNKDTVLLYYNTVQRKTDSLIILANNLPVDTILFNAKTTNKDSILLLLPPLGLYVALTTGNKRNLPSSTVATVLQHDYNEPFSLKFNRPINKIDAARIVLLEDSTKISIPFRIEKKDALTYLFHVERAEKIKQGTLYELVVNDSFLTDFYGLNNKKILQQYLTTKKDDYGDIIITIDSINTDKQYIMQLFNDKAKIIAQEIITNSATFKKSYPRQKVGAYKLKVIVDENRNGQWDTGSFLQKTQPETILVFPEKIEVRAKWENEVEFKINASPKKKGLLDNKTLTD
jgi:hypothetical protein